jgi:hypothetical protein
MEVAASQVEGAKLRDSLGPVPRTGQGVQRQRIANRGG